MSAEPGRIMSGPFAGPEHESYLTLMRDLRLPRVYWQPGDLRWRPHANPAAWPGQVMVVSDADSAEAASMAGDRASVWLPRLDQWLDLIPLLGGERIAIHPAGDGSWQMFREVYQDVGGWEAADGDIAPPSPTLEEAAARLWFAVTGRAEREGFIRA